jgi:hypothetical protein
LLFRPTLLQDVAVTGPGFRYLGFDVARQVNEQTDKAAFVDIKYWQFGALDMSSQAVPAKGFDLALTRDTLQHLSSTRVVACPIEVVGTLQ